MKTDTFKAGIDYLHKRFSNLPGRRVGDNFFIAMKDIGLSAFSVFFTQSSSLSNAGTSPFLKGRMKYFLGMAEEQLSNPEIMQKDLSFFNSTARNVSLPNKTAEITAAAVDFLLENTKPLDKGKDAAALFLESKRSDTTHSF